MPALSLPCFAGGDPVPLFGLDRPVVINLWASWCAPCRAELPEFQRLADRYGDRLLVLGVVTGDSRAAAASLARDLNISFPAVFDESAQVQRSVNAPSVLPVTLFVDAAGRLTYVDATGALTEPGLTELVGAHLGVLLS
jgi:thiol-disulfide isomerase/thioredoxin